MKLVDKAQFIRLLTAFFIVCALILLTANFASSASAQELKKVTFGLPTAMGANNAPMAVAISRGYFRDEGLDVEIIYTNASATTVQAVLAGKIDIGSATVEPILQIRQRGGKNSKTILIYNYIRQPTGSLAVLASSRIKKLEDFKGTLIGVSSLSSGNLLLANGILAKAGLQVDKDFSHIAVGTGPAAMNALATGKVDALSLWDTEYAAMESAGVKIRTLSHPDAQKLFSTTYFVTPEFLEKNETTIQKFGRAMSKGTYFTSINPEAALRVMYKNYPQTRTAGKTLEQEVAKDLIALRARLALLVAGDPMSNHTWGKYEPAAITEWVKFALSSKIIPGEVDTENLYTNKFVETYSGFDAKKIENEAKNWTD